MRNWKKRLNGVLFPCPAFIVLLVPASTVLLIYSFLLAEPTDGGSIVSYLLSFYTLIVLCARIPDGINLALQFKQNNKYIVRYTSDVRLRINISLFRSFFFNAAYAIFQLCLGIYHGSVWFYAMACYYLFLAGMRLVLVRYTSGRGRKEDWLAELKKYRFCGVCLLVMNLVLSVIVFYIVWQGRTFRHHEITVIAMAAYTFGAFGAAIVNVIRYRRYKSPVYSAAKAVSLASAVVSMLTLETAMLTTFGQEDGEMFRRIMLGSTGTVVVLFVQGMAIYMIVNACRNIKSNNLET